MSRPLRPSLHAVPRATNAARLALAAAMAALLFHAPPSRADGYAGGPGHASALLPDGTIVVVGGDGLDGAPSSAAMLYRADQPGTTGSLATARSRHTATALFDGRILVAGGSDGTGPVGSLELYDPLTGTFTPSKATLAVPRQGHVTVGLADGRILVRGGRGADGQTVARDELYDPRADAVDDAPAGLAVATVGTDSTDYLPGDTVYVSGAGWQPGESVDLLFDEEPLVHAPVVIRTVADANGEIREVSTYHVDDSDLGTAFTLHAVGASSLASADATFTDGNNLKITQQPTSVSLLVGQTIAIRYRISANANQGVSFTKVKVTVTLGASLQKIGSDPSQFNLGPAPAPWQTDLVLSVQGTGPATGIITITVTGTPSTAGVCTSGNNDPCSDSKTIAYTVSPSQSSQTIAFNPLPDVTYGTPPFTVSATASSGLPVTLSASERRDVHPHRVAGGKRLVPPRRRRRPLLQHHTGATHHHRERQEPSVRVGEPAARRELRRLRAR